MRDFVHKIMDNTCHRSEYVTENQTENGRKYPRFWPKKNICYITCVNIIL